MESLDDLRQKIDAIDSDIIVKLAERTAIVEEVGHRKTRNGDGKSFIRPGREATMLRDLTQEKIGKFPKAAIAAIWRIIISSSVSVEQMMRIAAYRAAGEENCYWLAREYFGAFTPVKSHKEVGRVIHAVKGGEAAVGVMPMPWHDQESDRWWLGLRKTEIKVFATIPFVQNIAEESTEEAVAIANVNPEPTGDDTTLICIEVDSQANDKTALTSMEAVGLNVIKLCSAMEESDVVLLAYVKGFYAQDTEVIATLSKEGGVRNVKVIGAYANPVRL